MKYWIIQHASGATSFAITSGDSLEGEGVDPGVRSADTGREGLADELWDWTAGAWADDLARVEAQLLAAIDVQRAALGGEALTAGQSVMLAYTRRSAELAKFRGLSTDEVAALDTTARRTSFPWLQSQAEALGADLADVADTVAAGIARSETRLRTIEARALAGKAAVRAATTAAAKRAAAEIDWGS